MPDLTEPRRNIIVFTGENRVYLMRDLDAWKARFASKYGSDNITIITRDDLHRADISAELSQVGLFSSTRLIVFEGAFETTRATRETSDDDTETPDTSTDDPSDRLSPADEKKRRQSIEDTIIASLGSVPDTTFVIFVVLLTVDPRARRSRPDCPERLYAHLMETATVKRYPVLSDLGVSRYVQERLPDMPTDALSLLLSRTGRDIAILEREIDRLVLYGYERPITRETILEQVADRSESSIFALVDAVLALSARDATRALRYLLRDVSIYQIFASTMSNVRTYLYITRLLALGCSREHIVSGLGISAFQVQKAIANRHPASVQDFFTRCMEIEK